MKRTGCVGCPFNSRVGEELAVIKEHEPKMYTACMNVFGESYRLMAEFHVHRRSNDEALWRALDMDDKQLTLDDMDGEDEH